jgi:hypothetical protein
MERKSAAAVDGRLAVGVDFGELRSHPVGTRDHSGVAFLSEPETASMSNHERQPWRASRAKEDPAHFSKKSCVPFSSASEQRNCSQEALMEKR